MAALFNAHLRGTGRWVAFGVVHSLFIGLSRELLIRRYVGFSSYLPR